MEAAGIEPASRDASTIASTCVVEQFCSEERVSLAAALFDAPRDSLARIMFNSPRLEQDGERSGIATGSRVTPAASLSQGYLFLGSHCEIFICN